MIVAAGTGIANPLQGDFGESWLGTIAAGCGMVHLRQGSMDLDKADVQLTMLGDETGTFNPCIKVQVKTTSALRTLDNDTVSYDLDVPTYRVLRLTNHAVRRVLVVFEVVQPELFRLEDPGTLLLGRGYWASLEGMPETTNAASQVVWLPTANRVDRDGLREMLTRYGVPRSTIVPDVTAWGGA